MYVCKPYRCIGSPGDSRKYVQHIGDDGLSLVWLG